MREIKFRAWDKKYKLWYKASLKPDGWTTHDTAISQTDGEAQEWQQFTGLKDDKGIDIYEGDLLKWNDDPGVFFEVFFDDGFNDVGFLCSRTHYQGSRCGGYIPTFKTGQMLEVIGNIYENPELIRR